MEIQELRRMLVACAGVHRRKDDEHFKAMRNGLAAQAIDDVEDHLICVTSGVSFLGLAVVNRLLLRGYSVRIIVDNQGTSTFMLHFYCKYIYIYLNIISKIELFLQFLNFCLSVKPSKHEQLQILI